MQAYRDALNGRTTSFVLTPDSGFFRYFENLDGAAAKGRAARADGWSAMSRLADRGASIGFRAPPPGQ